MAVCADRDAADRIGVAAEDNCASLRISGAQIPKGRGVIAATRREPAAVRAGDNALDGVCITAQHHWRYFRIANLPDTHGAVPTGGEKELRIGAERKVIEPCLMTNQNNRAARTIGGGQVVNLHRSVAASRS